MMERNEIVCADALAFARSLPDGCLDLCLTSPPYWKLRENGPGQWGQEETPEAYAALLVDLFAEVRRALVPKGVLLLNLGDTYMNHPGGGSRTMTTGNRHAVARVGRQVRRHPAIRTKELVGFPWMVAFALRADGWRIRAENIWHKPNGVPETAKDRTTRNHEHVFHLTQHPQAYWDWRAVAEPARWERWGRQTVVKGRTGSSGAWIPERSREELLARPDAAVKNRRSVWTVPVRPYAGPHKAVMPLALARLCVLAGCPPGGLVLDPFMGAGTTAVAAVQTGRDYLGSELSEASVEEARRRVALEAERAGHRQLPMLEAAG
jgi:DNA modification methylase